MNRNRRSIRLKGYDYSQAGAYFVTICTYNCRGEKSFAPYLFGEIVDGGRVLNDVGRIAFEEWRNTPEIRINVELDEFVVMPNHFHAIVVITERRGVLQYAPTNGRQSSQSTRPELRSPSQTIGAIIRGFKSAVTKHINEIRNTPGAKLWQRNYYEHIIRNEDELNAIREYIVNNPLKWEFDRENPNIIVGARHAVPLPPGPDWEAGT